MLINLTELILNEKERLEITCKSESKEIVFMGQSYPVVSRSSVNLVFQKEKKSAQDPEGDQKKVSVKGETELIVCGFCDRCLEPVNVSLPIHIDREFFLGLKQESEMDPASEELIEEQAYVDGFQFDVDRLLYEEAISVWPERVLCSEDCKGICPKCGKNLNHGDCGCDTFEPDPRMAKIKDLFAGFNLE